MSCLISTLRIADDYTFAFSHTTKKMQEAFYHGDTLTFLEGGADHGTRLSNLMYYVVWTTQIFTRLFYTLIPELRKKSASTFTHFVNSSSFGHFLGVTGAIANAFSLLKESFALIRQSHFISIFHKYAWEAGEAHLALSEIIDHKPSAIEKILPAWLQDEISQRGGKLYLQQLQQKIGAQDASAEEEGRKLLCTIRSSAKKMRVIHWIGWTASLLGMIGFIAVTVACPYVVTAALIWSSLALLAAKIVVSKGWVENPQDGFSLLNCLPVFLQDRYHLYQGEKMYRQMLNRRHIIPTGSSSASPYLLA